jgi:hypothetical protein
VSGAPRVRWIGCFGALLSVAWIALAGGAIVAGPAADVPFRSRTLAKTIREPSGENVAECASRASRRRPVPSGAARVQLQRRALRDGRERREPSAAHAQPGDDGSPDWSPDGGRIAFSSNRNFPDGAGFEIYSIRPDSACLTWLTNGTPESTAPDWRPGAGASSDPGRCGDAARPALIETDVRDVARLEGSRPLWLGRSFRGLLLTGAERTRPGIFFRYDDCARYDPRECPEELHVSQASVCAPDSHLPFLTSNRERYSRRRGAFVVDFGPQGGIDAYTCGLEVHLSSDDKRQQVLALGHLRPFGRESRDSRRLRPPALPRELALEVHRTVVAHRLLVSVPAVARLLGVSRERVRRHLDTAKVLREFGPFRTVRCESPA